MTRTKTQAHGRAAKASTAAAAVGLLLAIWLALAATAHAGGRGFAGVVDPFLNRCEGLRKQNCLSDEDLRRMDRSGIRTARWGFRWSEVEKVRGFYDWRVTDRTIGALANRGIRVLPVMTGTPRWTGLHFGAPPLNTRGQRKGWRRFLRASAERYGPGGIYWTKPNLYRRAYPDGPIRAIRAWQIWNEQNIRRGPQFVKPYRYRRLVRMAHNSLTAVQPKATIVLGGMPGYIDEPAWTYLHKLYKKRRFKRKFDAVAVHPYSPDARHVFIQVRAMRRVMKFDHDRRAALWITELGWGSKHPSRSAPINKGLRGQKRMLKKTYPRLKRHRRGWRLRHAYWFRWRDPPPGTPGCTFCSSSGLLHYSEEPKPAWRAFKKFVRGHRRR